MTLDCINCFIAGSVKVTGHISVDHFHLKDLSIDGVPQGLKGAMELEAQITKYEKPDSWKFTKELFSAPVPDAGIEIPGIFKLGAVLSYEIGVQAQLQGSATIDFGLALNVPDTAAIHTDIMNPSASTAQGLAGDITPIFDIKALSATVQLSAFAQPKLSFGVSLTQIGTVDIALTFKMPQIAVKFIAAYSMFFPFIESLKSVLNYFLDESGLCSHGPGASQTGVQITSQVGLELDLQIDASLGKASTMKPSYWMKLWSDYHQLGSACFPIAIPGLTKPTSASLPPLPVGTGNNSFPVANFSMLTGSAYSTYSVPTIAVPVPSAAPLSGNASNVVVPTGFLRSSVSGAAQSTGSFVTTFPLSTGGTAGAASPTGRYPVSNSSSILPSGSGFKKPNHRHPPSDSGAAASTGSPAKPTGPPPPPPSGTGATASTDYPPKPTGPPPPPPYQTGSAASSGFVSYPSVGAAGSGGHHHAGASSESHSEHRGPYTMPGRVKTLSHHSSKKPTSETEVAPPFPTNGEGSGGHGSGAISPSGLPPAASHYRHRGY